MHPDHLSRSSIDFGHQYWRTVPSVPHTLPELMPNEIDDASFRYLADNVPTLCWIARGDGYIVWYNRRWHEYCGSTPAQMDGWGWQSVHDSAQLHNVIQQWTDCITTGDAFEMTFSLKGADGIFRPFLTRVQPIRDASGKVARWFGINTDMTDQKKIEALLQSSRDRSVGVIDAMSEGLVLMDTDFRVLDINAEGLRIDGRSKDAIIGKCHWDVWPGTEHSEQGNLYKRVMKERISLSTEIFHIWEDGHRAWIDVRAFPHPEGLALFYRDISERKRAEIALRDSEAFTRLLLDSTSEAFYAIDITGRTTRCNESFLQLLGFDHQDAVVGRSMHELIHHSHSDGTPYPAQDCPIYQAASLGIRAVVSNETFFRADGTPFSVTYRAEPIMQNGKLQGAICTFSDITKRLQAEKRSALFLSLKDQLHQLSTPSDIIRATVDMLGQYLNVSRVGFGKVEPDEQTISCEIDYVDGVDHLIGSFSIDHFGRGNIPALKRGETTAYADLTVDWRTRDVDWSGRQTRSAMWIPLLRQHALTAILYVHHRTIRQWTGDEIALVQEVASRTWDALERTYAEESLRQIAADLSEINNRKTEFLATLAHELRNPLAPLRTGLELMRLSKDKPEVVERIRTMMARQIGNMVHLIDDLLDVARISSGKIELMKEIISLQQVFASAIETSMPLIESKSHQLTVDLPTELIWINADSVRLMQVLSNLLTNAAKYTPSNGKLTLIAQREENEIVISVNDNGIGIAKESLNQVFKMFAQIKHQIDPAQGGLGIGLSLVHRLVHLHGGSVTATSPGIGQGSTFIVRLPLAHSEGEKPALINDVQASSKKVNQQKINKKLHILVADDNLDAAEMLANLLQVAGHQVRVANDGRSAVQLALENKPDVAIIDIGMPGMNGYEVAQVLRKTPEMQNAVLVALTGWGSADDHAASRVAGFDHHLTKPVQVDKVDSILFPLTMN